MRTHFALALAAMLIGLPALPALAQGSGGHGDHGSHGDRPGTPGRGPINTRETSVPLRLAVDGKRNPELISDELAYRHFVLIASERADERADVSPASRHRREGRVAKVGLSQRDGRALTSALASVRERLDAIREARAALPADPPREQVAALRDREVAIVDGAIARIKVFLSPDGRARLERHLRQQIKKNIVVYGD